MAQICILPTLYKFFEAADVLCGCFEIYSKFDRSKRISENYITSKERNNHKTNKSANEKLYLSNIGLLHWLIGLF